MNPNTHINLSAYDSVEQLTNFNKESFESYCDEKIKGTVKHITFFKNLFPNNTKLKVVEIGSGNSKLLYALEKEGILDKGIGIEISKSRYLFAEEFKKYMKSVNVENINKNIFEIDSVSNFDVVIGIDLVMQLISPVSKNSEIDFLNWSYDTLNEGGKIILELWSFEHILKQLEFSDGSLKLWEEFHKTDVFEYLLSNIYLNESGDICWDKVFLKRNSNDKSSFNNILKPYSKKDIEKILMDNGFENVDFFTRWSIDCDNAQDEYIVTATKKENR